MATGFMIRFSTFVRYGVEKSCKCTLPDAEFSESAAEFDGFFPNVAIVVRNSAAVISLKNSPPVEDLPYPFLDG